jgi:C_GCAxxG_C_C family probable redox protein
MWEVSSLGNEDFLWSAVGFMGGIAGEQRAPCGALSAAVIYLGLRHRCPLEQKEKAKEARRKVRLLSGELVHRFARRFGAVSCLDLVGIDFSRPQEYQRFLGSKIWQEKCDHYIQFVIEQLFRYESEGAGKTSDLP